MPDLLMSVVVVAEERGLDPDIVKPGWLALGLVALLCVAVFLLARSFMKHTRKAAEPWEGDPAEGPAEDDSRR